MKRNLCLAVLIIFSIVAVGCAGKRVKVDPNDPVWKYKQEFLNQYGFFVTEKEIVSYYQDTLGVVGKEKEILENLTTIEGIDKFIEVFMKVRDINPNTPENEFQDEKDQRIKDIENEIFASNPDIPGTYFANNGGLKGDMAHVYLFYGVPHYKAKLFGGNSRHVDLMVWYYFDVSGRTLFRFLFYDNYGSTRLFKKYIPILNQNDLLNPLTSPFKEISSRFASTPEELYEIWLELEREDPREIFAPQGVFLSALLEFSSYTHIDKDKKTRLTVDTALEAPEPAALTAKRAKPVILGQPGDLTGREFLNSAYHSFIPAILRMGTVKDTGKYTFSFLFKSGNLDWEIKSDKEAECFLSLRISFQNKTTKEIKEFLTGIKLAPSKEYLEKNKMTAKEYLEKNRNNYFPVFLDQLSNTNTSSPGKLADLVTELGPGTYILNVDLRHMVTKKSAGGWWEEITI